MEIPITVAKYMFENDLASLIKSSPLPAFVIESILKDVIVTVKRDADIRLGEDLKMYKAALKEAK